LPDFGKHGISLGEQILPSAFEGAVVDGFHFSQSCDFQPLKVIG
jgi:hypothetical protein